MNYMQFAVCAARCTTPSWPRCLPRHQLRLVAWGLRVAQVPSYDFLSSLLTSPPPYFLLAVERAAGLRDGAPGGQLRDHRSFVCGGMHTNDATWQQNWPAWPLGMLMQVLHHQARKWATRVCCRPPSRGTSRPARLVGRGRQPHCRRTATVLRAQLCVRGRRSSSSRSSSRCSSRSSNSSSSSSSSWRPPHPRGPGARPAHARASLYQQGSKTPLNGSRTLPDYYFRNWGVATRILGLEPSEEGRAGAKARPRPSAIYLSWQPQPGGSDQRGARSPLLILPPAQSARRRCSRRSRRSRRNQRRHCRRSSAGGSQRRRRRRSKRGEGVSPAHSTPQRRGRRRRRRRRSSRLCPAIDIREKVLLRAASFPNL